MKTLELKDMEGNLVLTTKINVSGDNYVWKTQTGLNVFLGCLSLTEDPIPVEDDAEDCVVCKICGEPAKGMFTCVKCIELQVHANEPLS